MRGRPRPRPSGVVTLLTDFGLDDAYVGIVKGVVLAINPGARLVDLCHTVPPQDVRRGALLLEGAWRFFPPGTVHLAVVDPGVGGARRAIAVEAAGHRFVGPDNGLLGFCFDLPGARGVILSEPRFHRRPVSRTFHARDLFGPVAGHCSRGIPLEALGPPLDRPVRLPGASVRRAGGRVEGEVLLVDRFGNALTNLTARDLPDRPGRCVLAVRGARIRGLSGTYAERRPGELGALIDSSGRVEIFVRNGSARARLGLEPGVPVSLWSMRSAPRPRRTPRPRSRRRSTTRGSRTRSPSSRPPSPSSGPRRGSRSRTSRRPSG
jgi:S-adenosylmethionine hydrolase